METQKSRKACRVRLVRLRQHGWIWDELLLENSSSLGGELFICFFFQKILWYTITSTKTYMHILGWFETANVLGLVG
jgi:hypothetical protein